ncbi:hypothetical protein J4421_03975 [Candidatus Woesearchaeota archaeon]|nr:hypothetical protein [Candidatus Woesearchaeota archaeon]
MDTETYYEKNLVINNRELQYKGIFRFDDLVAVINRATEKLHYEKREKKTEEIVTEEGRKTYLELRPIKMVTKYIKLMIKIKITVSNATQTIEEVEGLKRKFDHGDLLIVFDSWVLTDYGHRWGMKPYVYFLKSMINKYLYSFPLEGSASGELASDTTFIYAQIKQLLESYKHELGKIVKEEEVVRDVEEEIRKEIEEGEKE